MSCAICQGELNRPVTHGACGANFCHDHLADWIRTCTSQGRAATCPVCRGNTPSDPSSLRINHDLDAALRALSAASTKGATGGTGGAGAGAGAGTGSGGTVQVAAAAAAMVEEASQAPSRAALSRACWDGDEALARSLIRPDTVNVGLPLTHACMHNLPFLAMRLIEAGAEVDPHQDGGGNPLTWMCWHKATPVALELISRGANVDYKELTWPHNTPLTNACYQGADLIALALIDAGANVNLKNGSGRSPLADASRHTNERMARVIEALRRKGATM
jgi:hypothetical protein